MTMRKKYQQFFTPQKYSQVMIDFLEDLNPRKILDLAIGEGSLLIEAKKKWTEAKYYGNDIDTVCCKQLLEANEDIVCFNYDVFLNSSVGSIEKKSGKVDLCIGNPPFYKIELDKQIELLLQEFNLQGLYVSEHISSEVPFILQCLKILEHNGTLSLILPDGFFTNNYLKSFRKFIISNYKINKVIELPSNIFEHTKAKTHIMTLTKTKPTKSLIDLYDYNGACIVIDSENAINRMDYSYYQTTSNDFIENYTLDILEVELLRGKPKYKLTDIDRKYILHTTDFTKNSTVQNKLKTNKIIKKYEDRVAKQGDIVLARVGSSCLGNINIVKSGYFVITDCVFIIRTENSKLRDVIYKELTSDKGQKWIQTHAKGVAARHITLEEIVKFPINKKDINGI